MLNQTSELGVTILLYLGLRGDDDERSTPRQIAEAIGSSPTYTAKVCRQLAMANILRAQRGAQGGVTLVPRPENLTLLEIVEACQGKVLADYCGEVEDKRRVCSYHLAMAELHRSITNVLGKWKLADLLRRPKPAGEPAVKGHCIITGGWPSLQAYLDGKIQHDSMPGR